MIPRTSAVGILHATLRRIKRSLVPARGRVLYLSAGYARGTGGAVVAGRNQRWLTEAFGRERFRRLDLRWYVFDPLRFRTGAGQRLRALVWRVIESLKWHGTLLWYRPSVVFVDGSHLHVPSFRFLKRIDTVVFYHNVEQDYRRQSEPGYALVATETERRLTREAAARICLNERDSCRLRELYGKAADYLMPTTLVDRGGRANVGGDDGYLLFVGSDFFGNTEGLFWFIENCMAKIGLRLVVVGSGMDRHRGKYAALESRGLLEFRGYVEDLGDVYRRAKAVVSPTISGCGMKTKIAEALMYDKLIFGTDEAFVGYEGIDDVAVRCRSSEDFIRALQGTDWTSKTGAREYFLAHCEEDACKCRFAAWMKQWM